jgi:hypothetical protein
LARFEQATPTISASSIANVSWIDLMFASFTHTDSEIAA